MPSIAYLDFKYEKASTVNKLYEDAVIFTAMTDGVNLRLYVNEYDYNGASIKDRAWKFHVSYDQGMTWTDITLVSGTDTVYEFDEIDEGHTIMLTGSNNVPLDGITIGTSATGQFYGVSGDIRTLLNTTTYKQITSVPYDYCFNSLFYTTVGKRTLVDASKLKLPFTTLSEGCYNYMFQGNTNLLKAPELPTTTLDDFCYTYMFKGCSSLVVAPELPAETLTQACYGGMFENCTTLASPPVLPATTLAQSCYELMFRGCTTLQISPVLPATTLAQSCYKSMFRGCTALVAAPSLPATTLAQSCYESMFRECTSLYTSPTLPAKTLEQTCYRYMFYGCSNLNYIKILATTRATNDTYHWVHGVANSGIFVKDLNTTYDIDDISGVPVGWTVYGEGDIIGDVYNVSVLVYPTGTGTVTGAGDYNAGEQVILHAVPEEGYRFVGWYDHEYNLSSYDYYVFNITHNTDFTARFELIPEVVEYTITLTQDPNVGAILQGGGTFEQYTNTILIAPNVNGYNFIGWYDIHDNLISTANSYMMSVLQDATYVAKYEEKPPEIEYFNINIFNPTTDCGTATGAGRYAKDTIVTLEATPNDGYSFDCWLLNGAFYSNDASIQITVTEDMYFTPQWSVLNDYAHMYLTVESLSNNNYVYVYCSYEGTTAPTIEYSYNNGWYTATLLKGQNTIAIVRSGEQVRFRNLTVPQDYHINQEAWGDSVNYISIYASNSYNILGNIMSLYQAHLDIDNTTPQYYYRGKNLNVLGQNENFNSLFKKPGTWNYGLNDASNLILPATTLNDYCYVNMFYMCNNITSGPSLPATTLSDGCYAGMFSLCANLTNPPALRATVLDDYCYASMFMRCEALTNPPELPATTLAPYCYEYMFDYCTSITNLPALSANTMQEGCYRGMYKNCTSLIAPPVLSSTVLADYCYSEMFKGCTSLSNTPVLSATTLAPSCYNQMFSGCTSLVNVTTLPSTTMQAGCYSYMFSGCTALYAPPVLPATSLEDRCYQGMFEGCTLITTAPTLPATSFVRPDTSPNLANHWYYYCYKDMFKDCTSLNNIKAMFTSMPDRQIYKVTDNWLQNVAATGVFTKNSSATWTLNGPSGVPFDWTVQTASS